MTAPHTPETLQALRLLTTPTVANAIETFNLRSRAEGFMTPEVRCILPGLGTMVGYACTATIRAGAPPEPGQSATRATMWEHVLSMPEPRVVVIQDLDERPVGAFWGEVQANVHRALGCIGVVTNGGVRDVDEVRALGFHFFAQEVLVSHAYVHLVEVGVPVQVGGLTVHPGDLLHGDQHGVISIPHDVAANVFQAAKDVEHRERAIIDLCQSPDFDLKGLRGFYAGR